MQTTTIKLIVRGNSGSIVLLFKRGVPTIIESNKKGELTKKIIMDYLLFRNLVHIIIQRVLS